MRLILANLVPRPHPLKVVVGVAWVQARLVQISMFSREFLLGMACLVHRPHPLKIVVGVTWVWARLVQISTKVTAVGDASVANLICQSRRNPEVM